MKDETAGNNRPQKNRRFYIFSIAFAVVAALVLVRYGLVMLPGSETAAKLQAGQAERGPILDRNGRILAIQTRLGNITIWKPAIGDPVAIAARLAPLIDLNPAELAERINASQSDFLYAKKRVDQTALGAVQNERAVDLLPGVGIEPIQGRIYPEKRLASSVIGFVGDNNEGLAGIEFVFNSDLAAEAKGLSTQYGDQVFLTIDANVQYIVEGIARKAMDTNKAEALIFLAMDAASGDILAYVSLPDYDPNDIRASTENDRMDRPATWAYEPGSVFKVFTLASIMELGGIDRGTTFVCNGKYEKTLPSGEKITIKCLGSHGTVNVEDIIAYSCNAGAAYASDRVEAAAFDAMIKAFGFGEKTGLSLPMETAGFIRSVERWSGRSKQTIAIGQELSVSALQMIQAASVIANDGLLVRPRLVSRIVGSDGEVKRSYDTPAAVRVVSADIAKSMRSFMQSAAAESGTGHRAGVEDLSLAVKTGTAQLIDPDTNTYSATDFVASCLALLPADQPSLILYTAIIKPKGESYLGGRIAAPPVREVAEALADYLGIARGRNKIVDHSGTIVLDAEKPAQIDDSMPNLTGFSKRRLLPLLLRDDLSIEITGDGWVVRQSPPPGAPVTPGMAISLELE